MGALQPNAASFTASATGAVARPSRDKLGDVVCVKDYGARGDGTTDDTAAVQKAIDHVASLTYDGGLIPSAGGTVYFPRGTYKCDTGLSVNQKCVRFVGDGLEGTILKYTGTGDFITLGSDTGEYDGYDGAADKWAFENLTLYGSSTGPAYGTPNASRGIVDWRGGSGYMRNVRVTHFGTGMWLLNSDLNHYFGCVFTHCDKAQHLINRSDQNAWFNCQFVLNNYAHFVEGAAHGQVFGGTYVSNFNGSFYFWAPDTSQSSFGLTTRTLSHWSIYSPWFECTPDLAATPTHIVWGKDGSSSRILDGLRVYDPVVRSNNHASGTRLVEIWAGLRLSVFNALLLSATPQPTLAYVNAVSGVFPTSMFFDPRFSGQGFAQAIAGDTTTISNWINVLDSMPRSNIGLSVRGRRILLQKHNTFGFELDWSGTNELSFSKNEGGGEDSPNFQPFLKLSRTQGQGKTFFFGTAAPTTGTFVQGDIVWNTAPAASGAIGWACVTGGTPGTWKAFGAIDA